MRTFRCNPLACLSPLSAIALTFSFAFTLTAPGAALAEFRFEHRDADGGWGVADPPRELITEDEQARIWEEVQSNLRRLEAMGRVPPLKADLLIRFSWPTRFAAGRPEHFDHTVSNYVDHDPTPGTVRDFTCGTRTYDTAAVNGGHKGTDVGIGLRSFYKMDTEQVVVVAAAPGVIVSKDDANPDRSCGDLTTLFANSTLKNNVISIRHSDGSIAIYYHIKTGSATAKSIGDTVAEGEFLASVGSSGFSSAPHLHFEVRNASNAVIDPWAGTCNLTSTVSLWKTQEPYIVKEVLSLMPSSTMPATDNLNTTCTNNVAAREPAAHYLQPDPYAQAGVAHQFSAFLRDREAGDTVVFSLRRPDGTEFSSFSLTATAYSSNSFAFHTRTIPASEPAGKWTFALTYAGKTKTTPFWFKVAAPSSARVYEFHHAGLDHYFRTASAAEAGSLTPASGFLPTGDDYLALDRGVMLSSLAGASPVCRFYGSVDPGPNSHFYTADPGECAGLKQIQAQTPATQPRWNYEETAFAAFLPVDGVCPAEAPFPVYRLYNKHRGETVSGRREDSNHRFTTLSSVYYRMGLTGWAGEGVVMCAGSKP